MLDAPLIAKANDENHLLVQLALSIFQKLKLGINFRQLDGDVQRGNDKAPPAIINSPCCFKSL